MKRFKLIIASLLLSATLLTAQTRTGIVRDDKGEPLPGVSVGVEGKNVGTITDVQGKFSITAENSDKLKFSFVGLQTQTITVGSQTTIDVTMSVDVEMMDEVVVTALGIKREQKALGYAVASIKGDDLAESVVSANPLDGLQGKLAGVQIDLGTSGGVFSAARILLRGVSTLGSTNQQPIFVVDGTIIELEASNNWGGWGNDLKFLNADDVAEVSVLKGAAATALYGSRAINGAVVITTKAGKENPGLGIDVTQRVSLRTIDGPRFQNVFGQGEYAGSSAATRNNPWNTNDFSLNSQGEPDLRERRVRYSFGPRMEGQKVRGYDGEWENFNPQPNNFSDAFDAGNIYQTTVGMDGRTKNRKTSYKASYSYLDDGGFFVKNSFQRHSFSTRLDHEIASFLRINVSSEYTRSLSTNPTSYEFGRAFIVGAWPNYVTFPRNYNTSKWRYRYQSTAHKGIANSTNGDANQAPGNDLWWGLNEKDNTSINDVLRLGGNLYITPIKGMTVHIGGNTYNVYGKDENKVLGGQKENEGGSYSIGNNMSIKQTLLSRISYSRKFREFDANASVGGEMYSYRGYYSSAWTNGGLKQPGQYYLDNSKNTKSANGGERPRYNINSVYFLADVSYANLVYLTVTGRNDWNSALTYSDGSSSNNSYFYPSVSLSYLLHEQFPILKSYGVSFAKLRGSWAQVGNATAAYSINSGYGLGSANIQGQSIPTQGFSSSTLPVKGLRPERKTEIEGGVQLHFLNNRLRFDFAIYKNNTIDQIIDLNVPSTLGYSRTKINQGDVENNGVEIALSGDVFKTKNVTWTVDINAARNRTTINSLYEKAGITKIQLAGADNWGNGPGALAFAKVGGAYGTVFARGIKRDDRGRKLLAWSNSLRGYDFVQTDDYEVEMGNIQPDWFGGMVSTVRFKDFTLGVTLNYRIGGLYYSFSSRYLLAQGSSESSLAYRDKGYNGHKWTSKWDGVTYNDGYIPDGVFDEGQKATLADGSSVNLGGLTYQEAVNRGYIEPTHASWHYIVKGWGPSENWGIFELNYLQVKSINLSYRLPKKWANLAKMQSLSLSFGARDLFYIYNSLPDNLNPQGFRSNSSAEFMEEGLNPYVRTYTMALNLKF